MANSLDDNSSQLSADIDGDGKVSAQEAAEVAKQAQAELQAAIAKAEAAAKLAAEVAGAESAPEAETADTPEPQVTSESVQHTDEPEVVVDPTQSATESSAQEAPGSAPQIAEPSAAQGPLNEEAVQLIRQGYPTASESDATILELGALLNGEPRADVQIGIPLAMLNRHGLVAGATGTGKTRTLQLLAEQIAALGVPVFAADIKGDLSGVAAPGVSNEKLLSRTAGIGQQWQPRAAQTELFTLGGLGIGVPIRTTVERFGSVMLAKVLGLNQTQESSLGLVFHYAKEQGLPLIGIDDLQALLAYLVSDAGKAEMSQIGGLSKQTVGVIQRNVITFAAEGADKFFGEPSFEPTDLLRVADDGTGIINLLEVPGVSDKPKLFSTFLMFLLSELFESLPEVGDQDKPKLVFFFDEAHLLFADASKAFLQQITQTVRLIRSKGVGVFFVTQTPKDVPRDVLAQLGSRVQHALRAHTPEDAKALKATVSTFPKSGYDLAETLQGLATGEAIVTVMGEKGAPTPVAWTRLRAPQGLMDPAPEAMMHGIVATSPLQEKYGEVVDQSSAATMIEERMTEAAEDLAEAEAQKEAEREAAAEAKRQEREAAAEAKRLEREAAAKQREEEREQERKERERNAALKKTADRVGSVVTSGARTIVNQVLRNLFKK